MKQKKIPFGRNILMSATVLLTFTSAVQAQVYTNNSTGHLNLGFRQVSPFTANYQVVVDIGQATNLVALTPGTTNPITGYTVSGQLVPNCFSGLTNLTWSAFGDAHNGGVPGYPANTMWLTSPRATFGVQSTPPVRQSTSVQATVVSDIESILNGATAISGRLGGSGTLNTTTFVGEPINTNTIVEGQNLSVFIGGVLDNTQGTFRDSWYDANSSPINVEKTTPGSFTTPQQADLYEIRPKGALDPHTGSTIGSAYYVGYFQLNTNGTMIFVRAVVAPPAPQLTITRSGNNSSISFTSTNTATYTLHGTNIAGITNPVATWPVLGSSITGNNGTTNFVDTTTDTDRVYRVSAQ